MLCVRLSATHTKAEDTQKFQKPRSQLKILGVGTAKINKLNNEDPQVLGATVENVRPVKLVHALCAFMHATHVGQRAASQLSSRRCFGVLPRLHLR